MKAGRKRGASFTRRRAATGTALAFARCRHPNADFIVADQFSFAAARIPIRRCSIAGLCYVTSNHVEQNIFIAFLSFCTLRCHCDIARSIFGNLILSCRTAKHCSGVHKYTSIFCFSDTANAH